MYFRKVLYGLTAIMVYGEPARRAERPRRGRGADTAELLDEIRDLKESQEILNGEIVHLRRSLENLQDIVSSSMPEDCSVAKARGGWTSTAYVKPPGLSPRRVKCDQKELGGGWTVILSRQPTQHRVNFNATWQQYKEGFGDINSEYWIGNEVLHALTKEVPHQLHAIMTDWGGNTITSTWNYFTVGSEADRYRLGIKDYQKSGNDAGEDDLSHHNNHTFSTHDNDNDADPADHCSQRHGGGWWYFRCYTANPTGVALDRNEKGSHGMTWRIRDRERSLKSITLMIRPFKPVY